MVERSDDEAAELAWEHVHATTNEPLFRRLVKVFVVAGLLALVLVASIAARGRPIDAGFLLGLAKVAAGLLLLGIPTSGLVAIAILGKNTEMSYSLTRDGASAKLAKAHSAYLEDTWGVHWDEVRRVVRDEGALRIDLHDENELRVVLRCADRATFDRASTMVATRATHAA
ncbi:MAG: hypothetical protein U0230_12115 [Polyangiales bacterium]